MKIQLVPNELSAKIKVLGVGGAGGNAINDMIASQMVGVDFIAANTDAQALERSLAPVKIQLGPNVTRGLGAGGDPEVGKKATLEDAERLKQVLQGADMVFIAAGMGGGTGTGGAPVVAELSRELGALTVAVVSKPFEFEGKMKRRLADNGIEELRKVVDTIITIPNDRLFTLSSKNSRIKRRLRHGQRGPGLRGAGHLRPHHGARLHQRGFRRRAHGHERKGHGPHGHRHRQRRQPGRATPPTKPFPAPSWKTSPSAAPGASSSTSPPPRTSPWKN